MKLGKVPSKAPGSSSEIFVSTSREICLTRNTWSFTCWRKEQQAPQTLIFLRAF